MLAKKRRTSAVTVKRTLLITALLADLDVMRRAASCKVSYSCIVSFVR